MRMAGTVIDITARQQADAARQQAEATLLVRRLALSLSVTVNVVSALHQEINGYASVSAN